MSETHKLLMDAAEAALKGRCSPEVIHAAEQGTWPAEIWKTLEEAGLTQMGVPEALGGSGASIGDALAVLRVAGRFAAPVPLAETILAGWALSRAGLRMPAGPLTVAPVLPGEEIRLVRQAEGWKASGTARRVPWARHCGHVVILGQTGAGVAAALVDAGLCHISPGKNPAGEPRDDLSLAEVAVPADCVALLPDGTGEETLRAMGALTRTVAMAGALERVLELTVAYARERQQFGRPISQFQAIQQQLAVLASEVAATGAATAGATAAVEAGNSWTEIAMAKIQAGEAAGKVAAMAHQIHGAIGFTQEHVLHLSTTRLWSWRDEFGSESFWAARLGSLMAQRGHDSVWPFITT